MSTIEIQPAETSATLRQSSSVTANAQREFVVAGGNGTIEASDTPSNSFKLAPIRKAPTKKTSRPSSQIKRRLRGFLVELQSPQMRDSQARVAFVENEEVVFYDLPAAQLRRAKITMPNQPFEMDEVEMEDEEGTIFTGYRFKALAMPSDAYIQTLTFDDERKRKRDLILRKFGQTQG